MVNLFFAVSLTSIFCTVVISGTDHNHTDRCAGLPGIPGLHGAPGRDGRDGAKGDKGETGSGEKGDVGDIGQKGEEGLHGQQGAVGPKGSSGKVGPQGTMGARGIRGVDGSKGEQGRSFPVNWKQCVWDRADETDAGLIQNCLFKKKAGISSLRVGYAGNLRVQCDSYSACCSRWYFTFNGGECSGPMTIEGLVYSNRQWDNVLRHRQIMGYCENIPAGQITVGFHIGKCARYSSTTFNGYTGWASASRIMIEETPPPQQ